MTFERPDIDNINLGVVTPAIIRMSGYVPGGLVGTQPVVCQETAQPIKLGGIGAIASDWELLGILESRLAPERLEESESAEVVELFGAKQLLIIRE